MEQSQLPGTPDPRKPPSLRQLQNHDLLGTLPRGVMPTPVRVLEANDNLLFLYWFDGRKLEVPRAQHRIYRLLTRYGNPPDAPGNITVVCLWGIHGGKVQRHIKVYDWMGDEPIRATTDDAIKAAISRWWRDSQRKRG